MKLNDTLLIIVVYYLIFLLFFKSTFSGGNFLSVHVFDVGQGDAILINAGGAKILIDGGANFEIDYELNKVVSFLNCYLDVVILTHPHYDHLAGLNKVIDRCQIGQIMFNDVSYGSKEFEMFKEKNESLNTRNLFAGDEMYINGVLFKILWPTSDFMKSRIENINNVSIVVFMDYGDFEALFLGDAELEVLSQIDLSLVDYLIDEGLDVLKVSHHGAKNGLEKGFISALKPKICAISVGEDNRFGHPHKETLEYLRETGCKVLRTDVDGDISFRIPK